MEIKPFKAEDLKIMTNGEVLAGWPEMNEVCGPAFTIFHEGERMGCGGIRIHGIGEAWAQYSEKAKKHYEIISVTKAVLTNMREMVKDNFIWRLIAAAEVGNDKADKFLEKLGFIRTDSNIYIHKNCALKD